MPIPSFILPSAPAVVGGSVYGATVNSTNLAFTADTISFTRGGEAYRTNSSGQVQRVPYNLFTYSNDFSNAAWVKSYCTLTPNATTAPDGSNTGWSLADNATLGSHGFTGTLVSSVVNTYSVYAKANTANWLWLYFAAMTGGSAWFNLTTGVVGSFESNVIPTITPVGNGWYRCSITKASSLSSSGTGLMVTTGSGITSHSGTGNSIYIWRAQVVEGTQPLNYFPTTDRLNVPRVDYTIPNTPCLLLEPQRTNLFTYSEDASSWSSTSNVSISTNTTTAPNGTLTADSIIENTSAGFHYRGVVPGNAGTYAITIYVKPNGRNWVYLTTYDGSADRGAYFNVATGVVGTINAGVTAKITPAANGFYRCEIIASPVAGFSATLQLATADNTRSYTGDGTSGVYVWGAQCEVGAYSTSYIATGSASVTRLVDNFSRSNVYTNGLISASGGTWVVHLFNNFAYTRDAGINGFFLSDSSTGSQNSLSFRNTGGPGSRLSIQKFIGTTNTDLYVTTTDIVKAALKWNGTSVDVFVNGTKVVVASAFTYTALEYLAHSVNGDVPKYIQHMALYNSPLSDAECIVLTT